jgi:hypothetical protein
MQKKDQPPRININSSLLQQLLLLAQVQLFLTIQHS